MSLRWILPTVALALPALAQDAADEAAPVAEAPAPSPAEAPKAAPVPEAKPVQAASVDSAAATDPAPESAPKGPAPAPTRSAASAPEADAPQPGEPAPARRRVQAPPPNLPSVEEAMKQAALAEQKLREAQARPAPAIPAAADHGHSHDRMAAARAQENETPEQTVARIARVAFTKFISGDASYLVRGAGYPFYLDGRRFDEREPLFRELLQQLRARRTDLLSVDAVEVLTPEQMEKKHGKPPARLASLPWRGPNTWIAVGNLSGVPVVAIFQQNPRFGWQLVAFTD